MNPIDHLKNQLLPAFKTLDLKQSDMEGFLEPDRIVEKELEIGKNSFPAWRSEHNNRLGPYKGGIRFHSGVSKQEVHALSVWMTLKNALLNLPLGGGKAGVKVNPKELSSEELESLAREFVNKFFDILGPQKDVPAPDVGTNPKIMAWMSDEYDRLAGKKEPAAFTGKSLESGGSQGRKSATGKGGKVVLDEMVDHFDLSPPLTVAVQGAGNVGSNFVKEVEADDEYRLVAISDSSSAIYNETGFSASKALSSKSKNGNFSSFPDADEITQEELLTLEVDILAPAALEDQLTKQNASDIEAEVVLELANGPTTPEADDILMGHNIYVIPDILANAGGVTVSYFEWMQNLKGEQWSKRKVTENLTDKMQIAAREVIERYEDHSAPNLRTAAQIVALTRLLQ